MKKVTVNDRVKFEHYMAYSSMTQLVKSFLENIKEPVEKMKGSTIWMVNSTAIGGGVAEMLPSQINLIRELGLNVEWLVIEADDPHFFDLTKRIHNAIHGSGDGVFTEEDRKVLEQVNEHNLSVALDHIKDGDLVVIHDPQPMPLGAMIKAQRDVKTIWRCHIGLDKQNEVTKSVWQFLSPYYNAYDHFVFSLPSYVPEELKARTSIITPAIDPLSDKNRLLPIHKCIGILHQSGIINDRAEVLHPFYEHTVRRIMPDGSFNDVNHESKLDLIYRPAVAKVSRWDRLKGFKELMEAFVRLKRTYKDKDPNDRNANRIHKTRLLLCGPDPRFVTDDPEGLAVLNELKEQYLAVEPEFQDDIAILLLPMHNHKENALIVNAIQCVSSIVVQNSIQEGFGLTATEAMWKQKPVLVSAAAGLKHQVIHDKNGKINENPRDIQKLADTMDEMLNNPQLLDLWGLNSQVRVVENFTLFTQLTNWLNLLASQKERWKEGATVTNS